MTEEKKELHREYQRIRHLAGLVQTRSKEQARKYYLDNRDSIRERKKEYYVKNKHRFSERKRAHVLHSRYGLTEDQYFKMVEDCGGVCQICLRRPKTKLFIDHDHESGRVRGLLCSNCNAGIGLLQDSPDILRDAIRYLESKSSVS